MGGAERGAMSAVEEGRPKGRMQGNLKERSAGRGAPVRCGDHDEK